VVGVHADLRWQIESDREAGLAFAEEIAIALVGFDGGAEAGVLAHGPEAAAVHGGVDAAGEGEFAGVADDRFGVCRGEIALGVEAIDGKAGERGEMLFAFGERIGFGVGHFVLQQLLCDNRERANAGWGEPRPTTFLRGGKSLPRRKRVIERRRRHPRSRLYSTKTEKTINTSNPTPPPAHYHRNANYCVGVEGGKKQYPDSQINTRKKGWENCHTPLCTFALLQGSHFSQFK